jgi:hypothetical protein
VQAFGQVFGGINGVLHLLSFSVQTSQSISGLVADFQTCVKLENSLFTAIFCLAFYCLITIINLKARFFFIFAKIFTSYVCFILLLYIVWAISQVPYRGEFKWLSTVQVTEMEFVYPELKFMQIVDCLPYAMWWFLAMEVRRQNTKFEPSLH